MGNDKADYDGQNLAEHVQGAMNQAADAVYRDLADDYERHQREDVDYQTPGAIAEQIAELVDTPVSVLDIGSGTGMVGSALSRTAVNARVTAVDLVEPMLREIDCAAYVHRIVADAVLHMPIRSKTFDVAVAAGLMEHVIDPGMLLPEMMRVVKPGGLAVFAYAPNRRGQPGFVDRNAGLLSHDVRRTRAIVDQLPGKVAGRKEFNAYRHAGTWIRHESIAIVRQ